MADGLGVLLLGGGGKQVLVVGVFDEADGDFVDGRAFSEPFWWGLVLNQHFLHLTLNILFLNKFLLPFLLWFARSETLHTDVLFPSQSLLD